MRRPDDVGAAEVTGLGCGGKARVLVSRFSGSAY